MYCFAGNSHLEFRLGSKRKARGYKRKHFKTIAYLLTGKLDFSKINEFALPT